jgi:hypothetical protein
MQANNTDEPFLWQPINNHDKPLPLPVPMTTMTLLNEQPCLITKLLGRYMNAATCLPDLCTTDEDTDSTLPVSNSILLLHHTTLTTHVQLVHACLLSIQRDSIVHGRHSKKQGRRASDPYNPGFCPRIAPGCGR